MDKRWSKAENDYLKRHANRSLEELAEHFRTDEETVRQRLAELHLGPGQGSSKAVQPDAALADYDKALGLLYQKKWKEAAPLFENVVASADSPHLADRARQNLEICRQRTRPEEDSPDPYLLAVFAKNEGNLEEALKLCTESGEVDKDERFAYLAASIRALAGDEEQAVEHLEAAIRLEPKNRVHAFHDPDFKELQGNEEFSAVISSESSSS